MSTIQTKIRSSLLAGLLAAVIGQLTACGGGQLSPATLGDFIGGGGKSAAAVDTDRDGISDDLELQLGTDPNEIDTDRDGLTDHYELWGVAGLPVGQVGSLSNLPDPNGNGVNAALDSSEAGLSIRSKQATASLETKRVRVSSPDDPPIDNDLDGDYIPSTFELYGFTYEIDPLTGEDWFVRWDGDLSKDYYKTDPTKWSSDADPWSDWEEVTKRNLDQRLKHPGDHPCIPAYPDIQAVLVSYSVEDASQISSSNGTTTQESWTNSVSTTDTTKTDWNVAITAGYEFEYKFAVKAAVPPVDAKTTNTFSVEVAGHYGSSTSNASTVASSTSGLSSEEWSATSAGDTIDTAKLILNLKIINVGTLPASNARALFNLKLGDFIIDSFRVNLESDQGYGELEALAQNAIDYVVSNNGRIAGNYPGKELYLSLEQLKSLQMGAPLTVELVSFEADTLVSEFDPETGRRVNLSIGPWSPYQSALENSTARLILDLGDPENPPVLLPGEIPPRNTKEVRVFAYDNTGSYIGSPPVITLMEAFAWGFGARETSLGPTVTIRDPITHENRSMYLADFLFGFDPETIGELAQNPDYRESLFLLPLKPSNPTERVYVAQAPPLVIPGESIDQSKPTVYWAALYPYRMERQEVLKPLPQPDPSDPLYESYDPENPPLQFDRYVFVPVFDPVVRAYAADREGIGEVRFMPHGNAIGEVMTLNTDPQHPENGGFYEYHVPLHYLWSGFESVIAYNLAGNVSDPENIVIQEGSHLDEDGQIVLGSYSDPFHYGTHTGEQSATQLLNSAADFVDEGIKVGDVVKNTEQVTQAVVTEVVGPHELALDSWTGSGDQNFKYGDDYVIVSESRRFDTLGYELLTGSRGAETYEYDTTSGAYGYNFTNPDQLKSAPHDIEIDESVGGSSTQFTVGVDQAVGVAEVGTGAMSFWNYAPLRKLNYSTSDIVIDQNFATAYTITSANTSSDYFIISGDHTSSFAAGDQVAVWGSTGNDGAWTVESVSLAGSNTQINVTGDIQNSTGDGSLALNDVPQKVFCAKLENGELVKFQINYELRGSAAWRVGGIDYVIYEGI